MTKNFDCGNISIERSFFSLLFKRFVSRERNVSTETVLLLISSSAAFCSKETKWRVSSIEVFMLLKTEEHALIIISLSLPRSSTKVCWSLLWNPKWCRIFCLVEQLRSFEPQDWDNFESRLLRRQFPKRSSWTYYNSNLKRNRMLHRIIWFYQLSW